MPADVPTLEHGLSCSRPPSSSARGLRNMGKSLVAAASIGLKPVRGIRRGFDVLLIAMGARVSSKIREAIFRPDESLPVRIKAAFFGLGGEPTVHKSRFFRAVIHSPLDASPRLLLWKSMLTKERPHLPRRVDTAAIRPDQPFRHYRLAVGPLMASSLDCVEHHACIVSAVRVLEARDIRSDRRFDGIRSAPVSPRPIRHKARNARKCVVAKL